MAGALFAAQMMAAMLPEELLIDKAVEDLLEYQKKFKAGTATRDDLPTASLSMLIMKRKAEEEGVGAAIADILGMEHDFKKMREEQEDK